MPARARVLQNENIDAVCRYDISVIIPVLNGEATLAGQLTALARQSYDGPWELIIADNGSDDRSVSIAADWRSRIPSLVIVDASRKPGPAAARNAGARVARAGRLAFCDCDDVASPTWLTACVAASSDHPFVAGALDHFALDPRAPPWKRMVLSRPPVVPGGRPFADAANLVVWTAAFDAVGGFCEAMLHGSEDIDLSWRLEAAGYELHFEPAAVMAKRPRSSYREVWRQSVAWGAADVDLRRRHRDTPRRASAGSMLGFGHGVLGDPRLRDPRLLLEAMRPRHRRSWVAAAARSWGQVRASILSSPGRRLQ
jgi:glycosyltransferase involved in cell wall biosynthesis